MSPIDEETKAEILEDINSNLIRLMKAVEIATFFIGALSSGLLTWMVLTVFRK